jgi:predicted dinucleotide-binding enzyme
MEKKRVGILGDGNVGSALARGLQRGGHEVRAVGNDKGAIRDVAGWAEIVILAVPFAAVDDAVKAAGDGLVGKPLVDVTNALGADKKLAVGFDTSGAEELQKKAPRARVVKAFNTVFAKHMDSGKVGGQTLSALVAGDDAGAKAAVLNLARDIGFDPVDAGPLENARLLEPLALLNIRLAYVQKMGVDMGFKLLHP